MGKTEIEGDMRKMDPERYYHETNAYHLNSLVAPGKCPRQARQHSHHPTLQ